MFDQNQQAQSTAVVPEPVATTDTTVAPVPTPTADTGTYNTTTMTPEPSTDTITPTAIEPTPTMTPEPSTSDPAPSETKESTSSDNDLMSIKKNALQDLTPLLSQLEQTPEEKFRTTMMLIQASDDQSLVQSAYDAAKDITDEKVRAQALLDIVNEINYFTQEKEEEK
jgi:hypothetical protein